MIVDSVEMENFKSYGDKQLIKINKGFTVIIGPNGSGKSNIGDSMLFVLGIRANKTVRVDRLEDFIHKTDPPKKHCYVTLNIINDEDNRYAIKRELVYINKEYKSNYYINNKKSSRNEVLKLIDTFHIYLDAYSFVLQGDINNLVKMTGTERRKLFESIAGIESYKDRIENAQNDINGLNENLNSMDAVLQEIQNVLNTLEVDRDNAIKYNDIKKELNELELFLKVKDRDRIDQEISMYNDNIDKNQDDINKLETENSDLESKKYEATNKIKEIDEKLDAMGGKRVQEIRKHIEELNIKITELQTKIASAKESKINSESRLRTTKDAYAFNQELLDKKTKEKKNYESYLKASENTIKKISDELEKFRQENYENSKAQKQINEKLASIDAEIQEINNQIINNGEIGKIEQEISGLNKETTMNEEKIKDETLKVKDLKWKIGNLENNNKQYTVEINEVNKKFIDTRNKLNDLVTIKNNNDIEIRNKEKELRGLNYRSSVSPALKEINTMMEEDSGIHGALGKLIEYNDDHANAILVAAGGRLNSIVVDTDFIAQKCIQSIKSKKLGRLTFIPLNKISTSSDRQKAADLVNSGEATDFVRNLVRYDIVFEKAIKYAFGDTVLMDTLEHARKYMTGVRIVTLGGDVLDPSGAMTGGSIKNDELIANRIMKTITDLEDHNEILKSEISFKQKENSEISTKLAELTRKRDISTTSINNYQLQLNESESSIKNSETKLEEIKNKIKEADDKKNELESTKNEIKMKRFNLEKEREKLYKQLNEIAPENVEIEKGMEEELSQARKTMEGYSNTLVQIETETKNFMERKKEQEEKIGELESELIKNNDIILEYGKNVEEMQVELQESRQKEYEIDSQSRDLYNEKTEVSASIEKMYEKIRKNDDLISNKKTIIATLTTKIENITFQLQTLNYEIENSNIELKEYSMSIPEIKKKIDDDNTKIQELGMVNLKAIEQYDQELDRYNSTQGKCNTLIRERDDLIDLQNEIIETEKRIFMELFDTINSQFQQIYARLSEGGEANLEITSREDPLNAEIYIKVKPSGKHMIKIDALSGGEKSVAVLALILSFQIKNPSPIYYLDEVDMFLDGHNAEHVGELFRENSKSSQVVMVSLKGAVTKFADNLIGVTVDKHGNTKIIQKRVGEGLGKE
ncbi:chromosome segregation protein SMC [Ferroplasma sp.]|uniref:chromosome segregation protein SMC n=1 Tax=Ferroplasma sp. TaxID=2591003 RepID=UPI00307CEF63